MLGLKAYTTTAQCNQLKKILYVYFVHYFTHALCGEYVDSEDKLWELALSPLRILGVELRLLSVTVASTILPPCVSHHM